MKSIKELLGLCNHKWVKIDKYNSVEKPSGITYYVIFVMQCEKCGKIKTTYIY